MGKLTPMVKQYRKLKATCPDAILLFRLGDFYEMFEEDARKASSVLNIALTSRNGIPMCGVPYHAAESYIKRLLDAGYKVAICEQVEDPSKAKGIVKREIVRVLTPGTFIETEEGEKEEEFAVALVRERGRVGMAAACLATGRLLVHEGPEEDVRGLLSKLTVKTVISTPELEHMASGAFFEETDGWIFDPDEAKRVVEEHFKAAVEGVGLKRKSLSLRALGGLLYYLKEIQLAPVAHLKRLSFHAPEGIAVVDPSAARHLELTRNLRDGTQKNTLLEVMNRTKTPMGYRRLSEAILAPLKDPEAIKERLDAVELLMGSEIHKHLQGMGDLQRIVSRIEGGLVRPKELMALKEALLKVPEIKGELAPRAAGLLQRLLTELDPVSEAVRLIEETLNQNEDDPYIIKRGYDSELDRLKLLRENSDRWMKEYEEKERKRTNIPSLKVRYNKVFGYYIEVTKAHLPKVPPDYIRKQTLVNAERFITEELKRVEEELLSAEERIKRMEEEIYRRLVQELSSHSERLKKTADALGMLDFLCSLAQVAKERGYCKPKLSLRGDIVIKEGRHPVVETLMEGEFVPNDTVLRHGELHIITGPNMSGKSTYIRQVALIVLMAQMGSFVPAKSAVITPIDRIFTRIGTADNLAEGQSTFMVEMTETANILRNATENSLLILDEVGRGTSTFDGLAIAWACAEHIAERIKAKALFATHYHELTQLARSIPNVKNYRVDVKEWGDRVVFTHKVVPGGADKSYGIYVAEIAGLPEEVLKRAKDLLKTLESERSNTELPLYQHPALVKLRLINLSKVSPLEALMLLEELKEMAEKDGGGGF